MHKGGFEMGFTSNSDEITRQYFDSMLLESRLLDSDLPSTETTIWGQTFSSPITTAALSHLHRVCENGMVEFAQGAKNADVLHMAGMGSDEELEAILQTGAKTVKVIKPLEDEDEIFRKIEHAVSHGAFAVGMDIDHCVNGTGGYDVVHGLKMHTKTTVQLASYVDAAKVPFVVKGVLSPYDAEKCVEAGAKGIIVSHHHGIMPAAVPPVMILPEIVKAVDGALTIFVDCGITSGLDAFKALACGADAVCVGRELMTALKDGNAGVTKRIHAMNEELRSIMARTGAHSVEEIDPSVVHFRTF